MRDKQDLEWYETGRKEVRDFRIFKAVEIDRISPDGKKGKFVLLDSPDWVNVIAVTEDEKGRECFLMVRQYRHGSSTVTTEFPAGLVDPGENSSRAAERELLEETGYSADEFILIGQANPDPAFMNNWSYTYLAVNPVLSHKQDLDEHEIIDTVLVPVDEVRALMGKGEFINAISIVAHIWYERYLEQHRPE